MDLSRLWKPFRATISFLADLGGALLLVVAAVAFLAAALGGAGLAALDGLDQPYFTLLVVGIALGAAGLAMHLLRGRMSPPQPVAQVPDLTPDQRAAALQRAYHDQFGDSATLKFREASRSIREELMDSRIALDRVLVGDSFDQSKLRRSKWLSYEKVLIAYTDPAPHAHTSHAYRELAELRNSQYKRSDFDPDAGEPLETDLRSTIEAIDRAVETLDRLSKTEAHSQQ